MIGSGLTLCLALAGSSASVPGTQDVDPARDIARIGALARRVADLPRAADGSWLGRWERIELLAPALQGNYQAALTTYAEGDLVGALVHLYATLDGAPDFPPAMHMVGVTHYRLRRYGDGAAAFERLLVHAPQEYGRTRALGHCYYSLGRYDEAHAHYVAVLAADPDSVQARFGLALTEMRLDRVDAALAELDAVRARDPQHAEAAYWRARLAFEELRAPLAELLADAESARDLAPYEPRPWFLLAEVLAEAGELEEAGLARARFEELDRAAQTARALDAGLLLDPCAVERLEELARLRESVGDRARAVRAWRRLVECHSRANRPDAAAHAQAMVQRLQER